MTELRYELIACQLVSTDSFSNGDVQDTSDLLRQLPLEDNNVTRIPVLKQIETTRLHLGMYLVKINDKWLDSPFWRSSFLITKEKEIQTLLDHGFTKVWIDTSKGLDPDRLAQQFEQSECQPATAHAASATAAPASDMVAMQLGNDTKSRAESYVFGEPKPVAPDEPRPSLLETERARASAICGKARLAVLTMFSELRMGQAVDADKMLPVVDEISQSVLRNADALTGLVRMKSKSDYTYMHSVAVCALMVGLARQLGMKENEVREAGLAGLLHDIGKMAIPSDILDKPGALSDAEFRIVKSHPVSGHNILSKGSGVPASVLDVVLHHHEKIDGSGYPYGLIEAQISRFARMAAVCDVYDALTSNRPYKEGWCPTKAIRTMASWKGHFDPVVFHAFVKSVGIYPVGSLVRLESGRLGVVLQQVGKSLLEPRVKVFFSTKSMTHIPQEVIDLEASHAREKIVDWEDPEKWKFKNLDNLWIHG